MSNVSELDVKHQRVNCKIVKYKDESINKDGL